MVMIMNEIIGSRIKESRKKKGLTQDGLGKIINSSAQVISNWERAYTTPNSSDMKLLSNALSVSADYLLGHTDDPTSSVINKREIAASSGSIIAFKGGPPEEMDEEEAEHVKEALEMFRAFREKRKREREGNN